MLNPATLGRTLAAAGFIALTALSAPSQAQPEPVPPGAPCDWDFPFDLSSGKIFVQVTVNGNGPYWFAVDSGSPTTVIDLDLAKELGMATGPSRGVSGAGEGAAPGAMVAGVVLEFGGQRIGPGLMMAIGLNRTLAPLAAHPIMGLIGNDWIYSRVVEVDYGNHRLRVHDPAGWEYEGTGTVVPARVWGYTFIRGSVTPAGQDPIPARFIIDTGAGVPMALNTHFVDRHELLVRAAPKFKASVGYGLGGELFYSVCRLGLLRLGTLEINDPVATLSQDRAGALAATQFDGLIGAEILSRFTVIFDLPHRRVIFEPGASAARPIEFDMSGIGLAANGGDGPLTVFRVRDGTPASEAGVMQGDQIIEIDGRPVTGADRDAVHDLFRLDGETRRLKLRRADQTLEVTIKLRRMVMGDRAGGAASAA